MKKSLIFVPLIFLLFCNMSCQTDEGMAEKPIVDGLVEQQNVEKVVRSFFDAVFTFDFQGVRDVCTDDFVLFESGKVMNVEDFINFITPFQGSTTTYDFEDVTINVEGSFAWMRLRNKAEMTMGEQVINFDWLESAVLKKQDGLWKIAFYHSTTVETPEEE